jgi:hyperosmotically inducible protein
MNFTSSIITCVVISFSVSAIADVKNDDSAINRRDLAANELIADQQSPAKSDLDITREIRQHIIADKKLSFYAHNIKIITARGQVTLRGPVRSRSEESKLVKVAQSVVRPSRVIDKIEITKSAGKAAASQRRTL